ncbi:MAG: sugar transferase [Phycisphaerae bacterium]
MLWNLVAGIGCEATETLMIITTFAPDRSYKDRLASIISNPICVVESSDVPVEVARFEPQDAVCVVDSMCRPLADLGLARMQDDHRDFRGATHVIASGTGADHICEHIERDGAGRIKRVVRRFGTTDMPEVTNETMIASFMPASALRNVCFTSLGELRVELSRRHVLSRDVPLSVDIADLRTAPDLLSLHEWTVLHSARGERQRRNGRSGPEGYTHKTAKVHPSVRRIGPVVIQGGVTVAKDVIVIGPTVLGAKSRIEAGATIAQSLVAAYARVEPGADVLHRIVAGTWTRNREAEWLDGSMVIPARRFRDANTTGHANYEKKIGAARTRTVGAIVKRGIDLILATVGLVVLALPLLVVALMIKRDSPGPILFAHRREGKGGREFRCWKFRSMVPGAHAQQRALYEKNAVDGPQFDIPDDSRITRLGRWLRRTNVDELPQLFNVICGDMSLVGPRPSPFRENQICIPWRRARLSVAPGITGMWQICRKVRSGGDFHQWIFYDRIYVLHQSVWLDLKILVATILTFGGRWSVPHTWLVRSDASIAAQAADSNNANRPGASPLGYGGVA